MPGLAGLARLKYRGGGYNFGTGVRASFVFKPTFLSFFYHWHDRMRSLRQGVRIWNFEEKTKQTKKTRKIFRLCFD